MTGVHNAALSAKRRAGRLYQFCGDGVALHAQTHRGATIIAVAGELDASNIHHMTNFAHRCLGAHHPLILDLRQLDFLAAQGIRCLRDIADECGEAGIEWALVPGHAVLRLLRICGQDGRLPVASSIDKAVQRFSALSRPQALLQLVSKSG